MSTSASSQAGTRSAEIPAGQIPNTAPFLPSTAYESEAGSEGHDLRLPSTPLDVLHIGEQVPAVLLSEPELAFISWMKSCAPAPQKRNDSWWTDVLKVCPVSRFLLSLSLSLSFSFICSLFLFAQVLNDGDIMCADDLENVGPSDFADAQISPGMGGFIRTLIKRAGEARAISLGSTNDPSRLGLGFGAQPAGPGLGLDCKRQEIKQVFPSSPFICTPISLALCTIGPH